MTDSLDRRQFALALAAPLLLDRVRILRASAAAIAPPSAAFMSSLAETMEIAGVPGIGMCVVQEGRVVWAHQQGEMDAGTRQAVTPDSLWPAASLSKPVFAFAALRLVDDGKLDLDKPLKAYVADHAPDDARGNRITARHVLSHSSGLRNWRNRADQPLVPDFEPGNRFQYSGEGFYYLQRAVEHIAGMGFEQFMQERLLVPLGMTSSTYSWRRDVSARLVTGHNVGQPSPSPVKDFAQRLLEFAAQKARPLAAFTHEDLVAAMETIRPAPAALPNFMIPNAAASLLTTPSDYGAFLIELLDGRNASVAPKTATRQLMAAPATRINKALAWGLGVGLEQHLGADYLWHWGDNGAWKNFVLAHPASRSAIVVFTNGSRGLNVAQRVVTAATGQQHPAFLWL